jgi:DNA-binding NarL/FixJ family response regulator
MTTAPFSPPDLALVALIAEGLSSGAVAAKTGLTTSQVKRRIEQLIAEHQCGSRVGLVAIACRSAQIPRGYGPAPHLPPRLAAVLPLVAAGMSNRQIGTRLHLSHDGIRSRVRDLQAWLGANSRPNTVLLAHRAGLLPEATT